MTTNPCKDCITLPMCKARFEPNEITYLSIMKLTKRCKLLYEFVTYYTPMEIHHEGKVTIGRSHQRHEANEKQVYEYYTGYNNE